jgi:hypothetical protein
MLTQRNLQCVHSFRVSRVSEDEMRSIAHSFRVSRVSEDEMRHVIAALNMMSSVLLTLSHLMSCLPLLLCASS